MGLGLVNVESLENEDIDGGPTEIFQEAPSFLDKSAILNETKVWRELALSLISLNEKTASTVDFSQSDLADTGSLDISCGRAPANAVVLQDPRVSSHHFTIKVTCASCVEDDRPHPGDLALELMDESSNGTWVNDQPVGKGRQVPITTGDRVFVLPSAHVGANDAIGYVVVALPFEFQQKLQKQLSAATNRKPASSSFHPEATRQFVSKITCRLCEDALIHRCVTVVPCGHNFCLGCMIHWCNQSSSPDCPACKGPVRQLVRNHSVDSIVDTFIRAHPEAGRTPESLQRLGEIELDSANHAVIRRLLNNADTVLPKATPQRRGSQQSSRTSRQQAQRQVENAEPRSTQGQSRACTIC
jgi:pSer/pThr/pTyr-binding forkhead associated (FHA) protein